MKKKSFVLVALCAIPLLSQAQGFSLKQCIDYATRSNGTVVNAQRDVEIADRKIKETVGGMLPQIDASGSLTDNILIPSTVAEINGNPTTFKMGTPFTANGAVTLTQKLFDPTFGVGLKAAKISENQARQSLKMSTEQIALSVSATYYQTLVIGKQLKTLRSTLQTSGRQLEATELRLKTGMAKQIDVDKMRVSYNNLQSQVQQSELSFAQSLNNLKYYMGMPVQETIVLTDSVNNADDLQFELTSNDFNVENRTDYQLQKIAVQAYEADKARNESGYLPSLNLSLNYSANAQRQEFNFFDSNQPWFKGSALTLSLRVPIFDGLQKHQRIAQSKLNIEKAKTKMGQTEQSIQVDLKNYENQYQTAVNNIRNEKSNLVLAESVYKNTQHLYQNGMATSLELVQSESSYNESMNNYYTKLLNLYIARLNVEQAKGNLLNYINNK